MKRSAGEPGVYQLEKTDINVRMADGKRLDVCGKVKAKIKWPPKSMESVVYVAEIPGAILGIDACRELGIFSNEVSTSTSTCGAR